MQPRRSMDPALEQALMNARYLQSNGIRFREFVKAPAARSHAQTGLYNSLVARMATESGRGEISIRQDLEQSRIIINHFLHCLQNHQPPMNALRATDQWVSNRSSSDFITAAAYQFPTPITHSRQTAIPTQNAAAGVARAASPSHSRGSSSSSLSSKGSFSNLNMAIDTSRMTGGNPLRRIGSFSMEDTSDKKRAASPRTSSPINLGSIRTINDSEQLSLGSSTNWGSIGGAAARHKRKATSSSNSIGSFPTDDISETRRGIRARSRQRTDSISIGSFPTDDISETRRGIRAGSRQRTDSISIGSFPTDDISETRKGIRATSRQKVAANAGTSSSTGQHANNASARARRSYDHQKRGGGTQR